MSMAQPTIQIATEEGLLIVLKPTNSLHRCSMCTVIPTRLSFRPDSADFSRNRPVHTPDRNGNAQFSVDTYRLIKGPADHGFFSMLKEAPKNVFSVMNCFQLPLLLEDNRNHLYGPGKYLLPDWKIED